MADATTVVFHEGDSTTVQFVDGDATTVAVGDATAVVVEMSGIPVPGEGGGGGFSESQIRAFAQDVVDDDTDLIRTGTGAGGVLSGTFASPGFAVNMAEQSELDAHTSDTTGVHGIADTTLLATTASVTTVASNLTTEVARATAAEAALQPLDSDLTAIAALATTSYGRALLTQADAAAARTALGVGTGAVGTDAIWTAKGQIAVATGSSAAAVLAVSSVPGESIVPDTAAAGGMAWGNPTDIRDVALRPPGSIGETASRHQTFSNQNVLTSGRLLLVAIPLPRNKVVTSISFVSATTAASAPTHQWFGLFASDGTTALALTADDTSTAWGSSAVKTLALTTPYTTTYGGKFFLGIMVAASTVPTLRCIVNSAGVSYTDIVCLGSSGLTSPPSLPYSSSGAGAVSASPYAYVS